MADFVGQATQGIFNKIDQFTFKMLIDNLKSNDYDTVAEAIDQLVKEKRPLSIAPLYFVSRAHPNVHVRTKAGGAIRDLGLEDEVNKLTKDLPTIEEATKALIIKYGNYKGR